MAYKIVSAASIFKADAYNQFTDRDGRLLRIGDRVRLVTDHFDTSAALSDLLVKCQRMGVITSIYVMQNDLGCGLAACVTFTDHDSERMDRICIDPTGLERVGGARASTPVHPSLQDTPASPAHQP